MQQFFAIGVWTVVGAALGPVVAILAVGMLKAVAYFDGTEYRPRPLTAWAILLAVVFAVAGSMVDAKAGAFSNCRVNGGTVGACLLLPASAYQ